MEMNPEFYQSTPTLNEHHVMIKDDYENLLKMKNK